MGNTRGLHGLAGHKPISSFSERLSQENKVGRDRGHHVSPAPCVLHTQRVVKHSRETQATNKFKNRWPTSLMIGETQIEAMECYFKQASKGTNEQKPNQPANHQHQKNPLKITMQSYGGKWNPWGLVLRVDTQADR